MSQAGEHARWPHRRRPAAAPGVRTFTPVRLGVPDLLRLAIHGLRARPLRVVLSALGIAIGIGAMLSVVGISASSRAELNRKLESLGTNLLTVQPGSSFAGAQS